MNTNATTVPAAARPSFARALANRRGLRLALGSLLALALFGERGAQTQIVSGIALGIDPLRVLDLQVKPNVIFVLDTSGSMQEDPYTNSTRISGDDPSSKMYQAKKAINAVLSANQGKYNFGFATYNLLNSQKLLVGNPEGTVTYVTRDDQPGALIWTGGTSYFSQNPGGTDFRVTNFDTATNDARVWRSFIREPFGIQGPGCAPGASCKLILFSRLYRNGIKFKWSTTATTSAGQPGGVGTNNILTNITTINCANFPPPAGMFPDDPPGMVRPCMQHENSGTGASLRTTTFWYSGVRWNPGGSGSVCDGAAVLQNVAACGVDNVPQIQKHLQLEIPLWDIANPTANTNTCGAPRGTACSLAPANLGSTMPTMNGTNPATVAGVNPDLLGVSASQFTPLGATLEDLHATFTTTFPNPGGTLGAQQRNFVIFLTDGAETCGSNAPLWASNLWNRNGHAAGQWAETIVIGFSLSAPSQATLNAIACAGSGGTISGCDATTCSCTGGARRNAFSAADINTLIAALQAALSDVTASGQFAASPAIVGSVFEYLYGTPGADPRDPTTRYKFDFPILFQPSFELPGYKGRLRAFKSDGNLTSPSAVLVWEAGQKLLDRVVNASGGLGNPIPWTISQVNNKYIFDTLTGGANIQNVGISSARIKRRILTSQRNGVGPTVLGLWPPSPLVAPAPAPTNTVEPTGVLDAALGLTYPTLADDAARFAQLQSDFGACTGADLPADCSSTSDAIRMTEARREAREMILAWAAGARVVRDDGNAIRRNATSKRLLFEARSCGTLSDPLCPGLLAESANSTPAMVSQPPDALPTINTDEKNAWLLFRDGPRTPAGAAILGVDQGFGLTSPDSDGDENPPNTSGSFRVALKPVMDVVYYGANDMLHAFRAGPQCTQQTGPCPGPGDETGGEELWGFVPYDQLGKLAQIMSPKPRDQRVYMIAASPRFTRVFVPGSFTVGTQTYTGRWRTVLLFGRGAGGKYYTALDVTVPGPFTRSTLSDQLNLPTVLWTRGNPDTSDGLPKGVTNNYNGSLADYNAYLGMGLTFSVPAIGRVTRSSANNNVEFLAYTGSGYSDQPNEGRNIYALDVLRGDVVHSFDPGQGTTDPAYPKNSVPAGPSVFVPSQLDKIQVGNPYGELATRVFVGDLHGRVWRFDTENFGATQASQPFFNFGPDQPIGSSLALLNYMDPAAGDTSNRAYVYGETGNESRVTGPPQFRLFALRERSDGTGERAFPDIQLPAEPTSSSDPTLVYFRGTAQPATAFNASGLGRVFFIGTVFKPCVDPPFESILYAVTAATGDATYDLTNGDDRSVRIPDLVLDRPQLGKGGLTLSKGLAAGVPPPPPGGPSQTNTNTGSNQKVFLWSDERGAPTSVRVGSTVCD